MIRDRGRNTAQRLINWNRFEGRDGRDRKKDRKMRNDQNQPKKEEKQHTKKQSQTK